jgi:hypothetical protein
LMLQLKEQVASSRKICSLLSRVSGDLYPVIQ